MNNSTENTPFRRKIRQLKRDNALLLKIRDAVVQESECAKDCGCLVCSEIWEFDNRDRKEEAK